MNDIKNVWIIDVIDNHDNIAMSESRFKTWLDNMQEEYSIEERSINEEYIRGTDKHGYEVKADLVEIQY